MMDAESARSFGLEMETICCIISVVNDADCVLRIDRLNIAQKHFKLNMSYCMTHFNILLQYSTWFNYCFVWV